MAPAGLRDYASKPCTAVHVPMETLTDIPDLERFPGALCRVDPASGRLLACNTPARAFLGSSGSLARLLGLRSLERLLARAREGRPAVQEIATSAGRLRVRVGMPGPGGELFLALEALAPDEVPAPVDALLDLVADLRWEWDLVTDRVRHFGRGPLAVVLGDDVADPTGAGGLLGLVHPEDRPGVEAAAREHLAGWRSHFLCEHRIATGERDGWRWVESRGRVVERDGDGRPVRLAGLLTDVTARRQAQAEQAQLADQLRQVQKLDALGQLTGGIAHDFNNILASVLGHAELGAMALRKAGKGSTQETRERLGACLGEIRGAADRGRELVAKMLVFSRGGAAEDGPGKAVASLALVEDTLRMLRPMLPATLALRTELDDELPALAVEPTQLQQLLLNLVINARDAVGENGAVTVRATRAGPGSAVCASCARRIEPGRGYVTLEVRDDGPGIPRALLGRIFDPFFTTKEAGRGSGLGLSVVHGIVHEHGGHLCLATSTDGTALSLLLPPADAPVQDVADGIGTAEIDGRGRKVLIVDDEVSIARWMAALLEEHGFVADVYHDPRHALRRFHLTPENWDLVLTDQSMPGLSGVEFADELLAGCPGLPVIVCSGYSEFVEASNAEDLGFRAFLEKPVAGDRLLATVAQVLERVRRRELRGA